MFERLLSGLILLALAGCTTSGLPPLQHLKGIDFFFQKARFEHYFPSAVLLISEQGKQRVFRSYGGAPLDAQFDLASLTKVFGTTLALMKLSEEGKVDLNAPASRYLKELNRPDESGRGAEPDRDPSPQVRSWQREALLGPRIHVAWVRY